MSFYISDKTNDPRRKVVRPSYASLREFWSAGDGGQNFLITGGSPQVRTFPLIGAVDNYLRTKGAPVVILHNDARAAATISGELRHSIPGIRVTSFGPRQKNYLPLSEMSKDDVLECLRGQITLSYYTDRMGIELCASGYLNILERYDERLSLASLRKLSMESNATIISLARQVHLPENEITNITDNANASAGLREILRQLDVSAGYISDGSGRGQSISGCLKHFERRQVLLIETGAANPARLIACLADEIRMLRTRYPQLLLVVNDIIIHKDDALLKLAQSAIDGQLSLGICSSTLEVMLPEDEVYRPLRALMRKKLLLKYSDGDAAKKLCDIFGTYEHITKTVVMAPVKPWTLIKPKAPGMAKEIRPRVEDAELLEMDFTSAILYGHQGDNISFVRQFGLGR